MKYNRKYALDIRRENRGCDIDVQATVHTAATVRDKKLTHQSRDIIPIQYFCVVEQPWLKSIGACQCRPSGRQQTWCALRHLTALKSNVPNQDGQAIG